MQTLQKQTIIYLLSLFISGLVATLLICYPELSLWGKLLLYSFGLTGWFCILLMTIAASDKLPLIMQNLSELHSVSRQQQLYSSDNLTVNADEFAQQTRMVLQEYNQILVMMLKNGVLIVQKIDDITLQIEELYGAIEELSTIGKQMKLLAIQAAVEQSRSGVVARDFTVLVDSMREESTVAQRIYGQAPQELHLLCKQSSTVRKDVELLMSQESIKAIVMQEKLDKQIEVLPQVYNELVVNLNNLQKINQDFFCCSRS